MRFFSGAVARLTSLRWHYPSAVVARLRLKHHWLKPLRLLLFLSSLVLCLGLGRGGAVDRVFAHAVDRSHPIATTPTAEATWLLQQGLERNQSGDVQGAIAHWQAALRLIVDPASPVRVTLLKYLVRAEQQVGAVKQAIAHRAQLIADYQQTGNTVQVGRMQTEQAQAYSSLGRQRNAIALLCHDEPDAMNAACAANSALAIARQSDLENLYPSLMQRVDRQATEILEQLRAQPDPENPVVTVKPLVPIKVAQVASKPALETAADVEAHLTALRGTLMREIEQEKRVRLE